jgi:hypothetical protein
MTGAPLSRKLGIRDGARLLLDGGPDGFIRILKPPPGVQVSTSLRGRRIFDAALVFAPDRERLQKRFQQVARRMTPDGGLWVAWLKKSSGIATDLDFNTVQQFGLEAGLVDNKVCAIDETWSALRFVRRTGDRRKADR